MGQEFFINSQELETKVRQLLPSQGGAGAGFDLSASTQIIPIIDLTESAEGSNVRADLQSALSLNTMTQFNTLNETETVLSNTGYWFFEGFMTIGKTDTTTQLILELTDGSTSKRMAFLRSVINSNASYAVQPFKFIVFLEAGHSVTSSSNSAFGIIDGFYRQLASIDGTLTNP
tara:strand:- start:19 stop:540 length:522 start_codon:yes stop_codon:yes gene_type:complete